MNGLLKIGLTRQLSLLRSLCTWFKENEGGGGGAGEHTRYKQ